MTPVDDTSTSVRLMPRAPAVRSAIAFAWISPSGPVARVGTAAVDPRRRGAPAGGQVLARNQHRAACARLVVNTVPH